jgi:hypothetical protein
MKGKKWKDDEALLVGSVYEHCDGAQVMVTWCDQYHHHRCKEQCHNRLTDSQTCVYRYRLVN